MGVWTNKEVRTREEWELAWNIIKPVFADLPVSKIDFPTCDTFYTELGKRYTLHKQHRVFKIFRALMEVAIGGEKRAASRRWLRRSPTSSIRKATSFH